MDKCGGAVVPKDTVTVEDVRYGTDMLVKWLTDLTGDAIKWRVVITAAELLPIAGSVFAATDAIGDIIELVQGDEAYRGDVFNWISLGINLFAIVPLPGVGAARQVMRPALKTLRNAKDGIAVAVLQTIEQALAAVCPGDLEAFVKELGNTLQEKLNAFAAMILEACAAVAGLIRSVATGKAKDVAITAAFPPLRLAAEIGDFSKRTLGYGFSKESLGFGESPKLKQLLEPIAVAFETIGGLAEAKIKGIANASDPNSIAAILNLLVLALGRRKGTARQANTKPNATTESRNTRSQNGIEAPTAQRRTQADPNCRKVGTKGGTNCSISFATGSETIVHTDFQLPGVFPVEWSRTYRSTLAAFDDSPYGARWITPFASRFDQTDEGLTYHGTDGRSQKYPLPKLKASHYDPIENVVIARIAIDKLALLRGHNSQELYERHGDQYCLTSITLKGGARIALHYEHQLAGQSILSDLVTYQHDTPHRHIHTQIDDHGRITALWLMRESLPSRQLAAYTYDTQGDLIQAHDEHGAQWTYQYQHHLVTRYTDRTNRGMNFEWSGENADARAIREWGDDGSLDTRLSWDPNVRLTRVTDANGHETQHFCDILGYPYRIIHADGNEEWLFRDADKNVTQHIHTDGGTDSYAYDDRGNLLQHTRPDGSSVHHAYDDQDQLFKTRDAEGGLWKYDYDQRGNIIETVDPLENTTQYSYNSDNLPVVITDANGGSKQLAYNADGQLIRYTDCSGKVSQWDYDALGQLSRFTDAEGHVTTYEYRAGQLVRLIHPDKTEELFERDAEGRLLSHTDALRQRTAWHYNEAGLIQQRRDADDTTLDYRWDRLGQLIELRNENNSTASFKYDPAGRLIKETGFDQQTTHYLYDHGSNQPTRRLDGDRVNEFEYDPMGRLIARHAGHKEGLEWQTETFAYDGNGNLLLAENAACKLQWFYDRAGNNTREHQYLRYLQEPHVAVWKHEYDALNQRIATTRPDGHRVSWLTYGSGHLLALKVDDTELLSYQRDNLHREIARDQGNGLQQRQAWTPNGQLQEQALGKRGDAQRLIVRSYRHDASGQLTRIDDTRRGALSYRYDPLGRLLAAQTINGEETFAFDPASNLLDPQAPRRPNQYVPNKLLDNLLRDYIGTHYSYDERGNLKERLHNGKKSHFTWDLYDRLIGYADDRLTATFAYDALGRRLFKLSKAKYHDRREAGPMWNKLERAKLDEQYGCGYTIYGWDGDLLAFESRNNDKSERLTHYFFEPGSFVPVAQAVEQRSIQLVPEPVYEGAYDIDRDPAWQHKPKPVSFSALAWYQCDHLGTPMELTDEHGDIAWAGVYKAWGLAKEQRSETAKRADIRNPLRFQGQYFDVETGLHYNRYRYYDPQMGRFIGKDPIGFAGDLNVYTYAPNPVEWVDPLGLKKGGTGRSCGCDLPPQRSADGRLRNADGTYAYDGGPKQRPTDSTHGNSRDSAAPTSLYGRYDAEGNFQKWGVTQDPNNRYSTKELDGGRLKVYRTGPRSEILDRERRLVERFPGPLNREPWAGSRR